MTKWDSDNPEILMPLRLGSLRSIAKPEHRDVGLTENKLGLLVLGQMLSALDYLACNSMCHRDVKPENILYYWVKPGESAGGRAYTFQLADFGLANYQQQARTECGTAFYRAPESFPATTTFVQGPKMDVWSLFATIADIHSGFAFPPVEAKSYADVLRAIRVAALVDPGLAPMVREDPELRPSAAQMLVAHFNGRGLTTQASKVEPIATVPDVPIPTPAPRAPTPRSPTPARVQRPETFQLVKYPRPPRRPLPLDVGKVPATRPIGGGGITKPRAHKPSFQIAQAERALLEGGEFAKLRVPGPPGWPAKPQRTPGGGITKPAAPAPPPWTPPVEQPRPDQVSSEEMSKGRYQLNQPGPGCRRMPGSFPD